MFKLGGIYNLTLRGKSARKVTIQIITTGKRQPFGYLQNVADLNLGAGNTYAAYGQRGNRPKYIRLQMRWAPRPLSHAASWLVGWRCLVVIARPLKKERRKHGVWKGWTFSARKFLLSYAITSLFPRSNSNKSGRHLKVLNYTWAKSQQSEYIIINFTFIIKDGQHSIFFL